MESMDHMTALAALEWQIELGADVCIGEQPVNRYALPATANLKAAQNPDEPPSVTHGPDDEVPDAVEVARQMAQNAQDLPALRAALEAYPHCDLRKGARNIVFSDGTPGASVMIIGESPGRDEDRAGRPFVGRAGQLLDKMLAAIDLSRSGETGDPVYISNLLPWRPPQNRDPKPDEIAMMTPFLERHIALADPAVLVLVGNFACQALLGKKGITRLRGQWGEAAGLLALPLLHPAYLLRNPIAKRETWADLLSLKARIKTHVARKGTP